MSVEAASTKSYVYYNKESGEISKIANVKDTNLSEFLEVDHDEVKDIILGKRKLSDFFVAYNFAKKRVALNEVIRESTESNVGHRLYQIPESNIEADIKFIKNEKDNTLKLIASKDLQDDLVLRKQCEHMKMHFSIT